MNESDFDRLLQRYLANELSESEKAKLDAWLEVMKTEDTKFLELTQEDEDKLFKRITQTVYGVEDVKKVVPVGIRRGRMQRVLLGIAATLLLLVSVSVVVVYISRERNSEQPGVLVRSGDYEKVKLADGTLVWYRGGSTLEFREEESEQLRVTQFTGEGLFEVAKMPDKPFVISCGVVRLQVLGTSFNLLHDEQRLELSVLTGRVRVFDETGEFDVEVGADERFTYQLGEGKKGVLAAEAKRGFIGYSEYSLVFTDAPLSDVLAKVGQKFEVQVSLADAESGRCRITGDFTDHSLAQTLLLLEDIIDLDFTQTGNTVMVTGGGCSKTLNK